MKQIILNLEDEQVDSIGHFVLKQEYQLPLNLKINGNDGTDIEITREIKSMSMNEDGISLILK